MTPTEFYWFIAAVLFAAVGILMIFMTLMEFRRNNDILVCRYNIAMIDLEIAKRKLDKEEKRK